MGVTTQQNDARGLPALGTLRDTWQGKLGLAGSIGKCLPHDVASTCIATPMIEHLVILGSIPGISPEARTFVWWSLDV